ncbi:MAG: hypothetical protein ACREJB_05335 [Planctomycetaceae bacterium]
MDDAGRRIMSVSSVPLAQRLRFGVRLALAVGACSLTGCSLFVMAGKMVFGDPVSPCAFRQAAGVDLTEGEHTVLVVCSTPEAVKVESSSLHYDLLDGVTRRLARQEIPTVNPDDVADWLDRNGGYWSDVDEIAAEFTSDYIIVVDLDEFDFHEQNSPTLLRGRTSGNVSVYQVREAGGVRHAQQVFTRRYASVYPQNNPISRDERSERIFIKQYTDRVCSEIAWMFYDHRLSEEIE